MTSTEIIISVAIITALFNGGVALVKALFGKNENKALEYSHQEKIIELVSKQNDSSERLLIAVEGLRGDVGSLREDFKGLNDRVLKLEEKSLKLDNSSEI